MPSTVCRVGRAVKIFPRAFHFDIGFIDAAGVVRQSQLNHSIISPLRLLF
jgi:hypothetical protein